MATIGTLNAKLILNNRQWQAAMSQSILAIHRLRDESKTISVGLLDKQLRAGDRSLISFSSLSRGAGVAAGILGGAILGLGASVRQTAAYFKELSSKAAELGMGTGAFQALQNAAIASGVSVEAFGSAFTIMLDKVGDALRGGEEASKFFTSLGLDAKRLSALQPEQIFLEIAEAIRKLETQAERVSALRTAFGKAGGILGPLVQQGRAGIAGAAGTVLGESAIKNVGRLDTASKRLWTTFKQAAGAATSTVSNWLTPLLNLANDTISAIARTALPAAFSGTGSPLGGTTKPVDLISQVTGPSLSAESMRPARNPVTPLTEKMSAARAIMENVISRGESPMDRAISQLQRLDLPVAEFEKFAQLIRDTFAIEEVRDFEEATKRLGDEIRESVMTPGDRIVKWVEKAKEAFDRGAIDASTMKEVLHQANEQVKEMESRRLADLAGAQRIGGGLRTAKELGIVEGAQRGPAGVSVNKTAERQTSLLQTISVTLGRMEKQNRGLAA